jgi:homocysteine S-methyltransferase
MRRPLPSWIGSPFTVLDGGLSTSLAALGESPAGALWTARTAIERPELLIVVHRRFVDAGAQIVITASYQASEAGFVAAGLRPADARRALASTTDLARSSGAAFVAASVGPFGAVLADGSEYHGRYDASWAEVRAFHRDRLSVLVDSGPDLFAVETIPTMAEAEILLEELTNVGASGGWLSMSCVDDGHTCGGDPIEDAASRVASSGWADAFGINCSHAGDVAGLLTRASAACDLPFVVYPNQGGTWDPVDKCWIGDEGDPTALLEERAAGWVALGARVIGGCCGTDVDQITRLAAMARR